MATLYVEHVPDELYEALRKRARQNRRSIAAEVLELLEQFVPTELQLKARSASFRRLARGPFASVEELVREDRSR